MRSVRTYVISALAAFGLLLATTVPAGALTKAQLKSKALSLSNFPTGWSVDNTGSSGGSEPGCFKGLKSTFKHEIKIDASYTNGDFPALDETIETGPAAGLNGRYAIFNKDLSRCKQISFSSGGDTFKGTVGAMSFPTTGDRSSAFAVSLSAKGVTFGIDVVLFQVGQIIGDVLYADLGQPDTDQFQAFVTEAINKIEGKPTHVPSSDI